MSCWYFDTSALVKLIVHEPESDALAAEWLANPNVVSVTSLVGRIELERAARRQPDFDAARTEDLLGMLELIPLHVANAAIAAWIEPTSLRTLDAIHLATVLELAEDVERFYCYDHQLTAAARSRGIEVHAPGAATA